MGRRCLTDTHLLLNQLASSYLPCSRRYLQTEHAPEVHLSILKYLMLGLQANDLINKLKEDGEEFEENFYFTAGYDAPFK